jgi:glutaminyl-peptide cyclotransferase
MTYKLPILCAALLSGCMYSSNTENNAIPLINYSVVNTYPHDTAAFTEGFLVHDGQLYESTGSPDNLPLTRSLAGPVDMKTGLIIKKVELDRDKYFGEGIVFLNGKLFQLTYHSKVGFVYDEKTYAQIASFPLPVKEGWGMTTDGRHLIISDGTQTITYLDPGTLQVAKTIDVADDEGPLNLINELEYINGFIYANIYTTNFIIKIDPTSGAVVGKLDLTSLSREVAIKHPGSMEMNGIAYDSVTKKIYVTGKMWPSIYEINFNH